MTNIGLNKGTSQRNTHKQIEAGVSVYGIFRRYMPCFPKESVI